MQPLKQSSIYGTLATIITLTVILIVSVLAAHNYSLSKVQLTADIKENSRLTLLSLQKNLVPLVAAYAVNEYDNLVRHELELRGSNIITIDDYNLAQILGGASYTSGKIRDKSGKIIDFDINNPIHTRQLDGCFHLDQGDILASTGEKIGAIKVCTSDDLIRRELNSIIKTTLIEAAAFSAFLIFFLFLAINRFILKPLSGIVDVIAEGDEDGIPVNSAPEQGPAEIKALSSKINAMVDTIRDSREELQAQHDYLQEVINGVDDPIMVIDENYNVTLMNEAVKDATRAIPVLDPDHPKCYEISHQRSSPCEGDEHPCPLKEVRETHARCIVVHQHEYHGEKRYVELAATPLLDKNGKCSAIIESTRDITPYLQAQDELREQKDALDFMAHHDALTGLANRVLFNERLEQAIIKARRFRTVMAVLFIDLDHFKAINDSLGHKMGDKVLTIVTKRLRGTIRREDTLARLGGDEFTILLENLKHGSDAAGLCRKILKILAEPIHLEDQVVYIGCSIGISLYPDNTQSAQDLLKFADTAMYRAKNEGRNNYQYYSAEMTLQAYNRVSMETRLREAIKQDQFEVFFQPQVDSVTGKMVGVEGLIRWIHPEDGLITPDSFLPLAETTGLIVPIDRLMMRKAIRQWHDWIQQGLNPGVLSLNLTIKQLQQKDFVEYLQQLMSDYEMGPESLELELTESQVMENSEENIKVLQAVNDKGVHVALDDFGTGYSSLSYLKKLPIHKLKIDKSFVQNLPDDEEDVSIAKTIIGLARNLNLELIAEGVETEGQKSFLQQNGCTQIQGYLYSRPLPAAELQKKWLQS